MAGRLSIGGLVQGISIGVRILIVATGAVLLMLLAAFPSALVGPEATVSIPHVKHTFLVEWKNWLWLAPWLLMEVAAIAGKGRNLVWFSGLVGVIGITMVIYPIIQATRPELIDPAFREMVFNIDLREQLEQIEILHEDSSYRDRCLSFGFPILWILLGLSAFLRLVVLGYLLRLQEKKDDNEYTNVDAADIAPDAENARTVKEIAANPQKVKPQFKFGKADSGLVARIKAMLLRLQYLRTVKGLCILGVVSLFFAWFYLYPQPNAEEAFERDLEAMYQTTTDADGNEIGTTRAVYAALRVMKYVTDNRSLENITVQEAEKRIQLHRATAAYRKTIRNEDLEELVYMPLRLKTSVDYARFLTITDGRHLAVLVLNLRTFEKDRITGAPVMHPNTYINFTQYFENGWDTAEDKRRSHPYLEDEIYRFDNAVFE